jgi:hypothetical protein
MVVQGETQLFNTSHMPCGNGLHVSSGVRLMAPSSRDRDHDCLVQSDGWSCVAC